MLPQAGPTSLSGCSSRRGTRARDRRCPRRADAGKSFPATGIVGEELAGREAPAGPWIRASRPVARRETRGCPHPLRRRETSGGASGEPGRSWFVLGSRGDCRGREEPPRDRRKRIARGRLPAKPLRIAEAAPFDEGEAEAVLGRESCSKGQSLRVTGGGRSRVESAVVGRRGRPRRSAGPDPALPSGRRASMRGGSWRDGVNRISTRAKEAPRGVDEVGSPAGPRVHVLRIGCRSR